MFGLPSFFFEVLRLFLLCLFSFLLALVLAAYLASLGESE